MTFAEWLQRELATRTLPVVLRRSGLRRDVLDKWLRGETWPNWVQAVQLAHGLGVHWSSVWNVVIDDRPL